ncbi:1-acylglycerol-3-phosphate O-acyltransferase [Pseudoalteromonas sp. SSDWG2]|uniref:1-acylglycerol-3-phosphate O-acyltransferase n=1 Tax=Pseudoalteromonas sp. SSDWG2 TaxID=3139391 RepID=UPI003BA8D77C
MLALIRLLVVAVFIPLSFLAGFVLCIVRPFHGDNVRVIGSWYSRMSPLFGVKVVLEKDESIVSGEPAVYIANHQNNYDIFFLPTALQTNTVSLGKKSLKWIPFFGQLYWLSGNILIDRSNRKKAMATINKTTEKLKQGGLSLWMFPEGTRSYGRGLLPFKTGAFHTAVNANIPVIPVVMSNTHKSIKLNRWDNGTIYIKMLAPQLLDGSAGAREYADHFHALMKETLVQLDERK